MKLRVGLTGGIGSGKSTVSDRLAALGATVVDADVISRSLTGSEGAAMQAIEREFGARFVTPDRALDRAAMRKLVFEDPLARGRLEAILHPAVRAESDAQLARATGPYAVLVVPLLFEKGGYPAGGRDARVDRTLLVDCPEDLQLRRATARDALDEAQVRAIMAAQWPRWRRLQVADDVIWNGADMASLEAQCARMHQFYLGNAGRIAPQSGPTQRGVR